MFQIAHIFGYVLFFCTFYNKKYILFAYIKYFLYLCPRYESFCITLKKQLYYYE